MLNCTFTTGHYTKKLPLNVFGYFQKEFDKQNKCKKYAGR